MQSEIMIARIVMREYECDTKNIWSDKYNIIRLTQINVPNSSMQHCHTTTLRYVVCLKD